MKHLTEQQLKAMLNSNDVQKLLTNKELAVKLQQILTPERISDIQQSISKHINKENSQ